ncbi:hypothetical protein QF027_009862 [Streptomyces canus]|nr:hypothetical protein [Streptomyces canus]
MPQARDSDGPRVHTAPGAARQRHDADQLSPRAASAHAVRVGLRAAGPEVSHGRLAPVAARCAAILASPTRAASQDGRGLRLALDDVLDLVVRATGDWLQIVGTGSQGDTVTSPPPRRFTS